MKLYIAPQTGMSCKRSLSLVHEVQYLLRYKILTGLDWIGKTWTGLIKHGIIKHGLIKHGVLKRGEIWINKIKYS